MALDIIQAPAVSTEVAAEVPKVEAATGTEVAKEQVKESAAARFAALAKKEKGIVLAKQDVAREREAVAAQKAELAKLRADLEELQQARVMAKQNPLKYIEAAGLSYEDLTNTVLNDKKPTADLGVRVVKDELGKLREEFETKLKAQDDERKSAMEAERKRIADLESETISQFNSQVLDFVKSSAAQYPYTTALDAGEVVVAVIREHYAATKQVLSAKDAADKVEKHYAERLQGLSKPAEPAKGQPLPSKETQQRPAVEAQRRTLTNGMTASSTSFGSARTESDRIKRAMAALDRK